MLAVLTAERWEHKDSKLYVVYCALTCYRQSECEMSL